MSGMISPVSPLEWLSPPRSTSRARIEIIPCAGATINRLLLQEMYVDGALNRDLRLRNGRILNGCIYQLFAC